ELDLQHSTLIVKEREPDQVCDTSTALSLHHALHRRSLALDLIGVTDYFKVQAFVDFLMAHLHQEPAAGSRATTVQQILLADRAAWLRLSELTPDGIRRAPWRFRDPVSGKKQRKGKGKGKTKTQKEPANLPEDDVDADGVALEAAPNPAPAITSPSHDQQLSSFFCLEVFAGSGRLTAELKSSGFRDSVGVDHVVPKHIVSPIVKLDLLEPDSVQMLFDMIDSPFCFYVHLAPPCGTASRAREIPGRNMPQPARSELHPDGLPALQGPLLDRVRKANQLYSLAGRIFAHCMQAGKLVSCENPANSHFWNTSFWCQETAQLPWQDTLFHHCQHGGQRAKLTPLRHNIPLMSELALLCPGVLVLQCPRPLFVGLRKLDTAFDIPADVSCTSAVKTLPAGTRVLRHSVVGHPGAAEDPSSEEPNLDPLGMGPEEFSHYGLQLGTAATDASWRESICHLCDLLRSDPLARGGLGSDEFSWTCGAYTHANVVGLRKNTASHPNVCKFLCEYVRRVAPGHPFTSIMLGRNLQGDVHIDKNNAVGLPNAVLKISSFDRGGIWVESPGGTVKCPSPNHPDAFGEVIDFCNHRIFFSPDCRHCQAPWKGGPRIVLVAYSIRNFEKLGTDHGRRLSELGFCVPAEGIPTLPGTEGHPVCTDTPSPFPSGLSSPSSPVDPSGRVSGRFHRVVVGIPWTPEEFIEQAIHAKHPRHILDGIPDETKSAVDQLASLSLGEIGAHRTEALRKWIGRARELEEREEANCESMPPHCAKVLGRKRLVLFEEMLSECGHEDTSIARDISRGFELSGAIPRNPAFRAKRSTASLPESELRRNAAVTREATLLATKSSGDPELDLALWEATQKEVDRGWLRGPVNPRSLDPAAVISRRFGIWQGDKCRPIDDFRASGVNATTSAEDSVTVHSADTIAASIAYRLKVDDKCRRYGGLEMKSYDLHKAYKNLPLSAGAVDIAYLSVYNPHKKREELRGNISSILEQGTLPKKECERRRGRLQFASNQIAGKRAGRAFKALTRHLMSNRSALCDDLKLALLFLRDCFLDGPPRSLNANILHLWHIYVDASCDDNKVGLGGVLISEQGSKVAYFSQWAEDELRTIVAPTSKNPIFEFECLAVLLAIKTWSGLI
ncbi:unnamed protein product, partial [Symbiodinium microadriaticum]